MTTTIGFVPAHQTRSATIRLDAPPERAFGMFTPLGERAWAQGWEPEFLHPLDGEACEGSVFITRAGGRETIWTTIAHDPPGRAAYSRVTPGLHAVLVEVRLRPAEDGGTLADVSYAFTALTSAGNDAVAEMADGFGGWMEEWETSINRALASRSEETARENSANTESANTLTIPHLQVLTQRKQRKQRKAGISQAVLCFLCFLCVPGLFADLV